MTLFAWDELACEIHAPDPDELRQINREGGWDYVETLPNGVAVLTNGRHFALECIAADADDAAAKFSHYPLFADMMDLP